MSTAIAERPTTPTLDVSIVQQVLLGDDLSRLTPEQRVSFYNRVCESIGLNPLTQPFAYLRLNGKEVLYAKKDATEQLRFIHNISIDPKGFTREVIEGVYVVTAPASMPSGRTDVSTGAVPIEGLKGEARANAMMKAETKAKRRVTLSICGLGMLDETEVETIPREPQYVVEAPKPMAPLPAGAFYIVRVVPKSKGQAEWVEVTFVDDQGAEQTLPTPADGTGKGAAFFEQLVQEGQPVVLTTRVTPRSKKTVIDQCRRYAAMTGGAVPKDERTVEEQRALDAEASAAITADDVAF